MTLRHGAALVLRNITRSRRHLAFSSVGLAVGSATLAFFLALSEGVRERIINRLYPVNQVELQPEVVKLFGLGVQVPSRLDDAVVAALKGLPGVKKVYPKERSKFQAKLWGGRDIFGYQAHLEAFFDGLLPELVSEELKDTERKVFGSGSAEYAETFRDLGDVMPCSGDAECLVGEKCLRGYCRLVCGLEKECPSGWGCVNGECFRRCAQAQDCRPGELCSKVGGESFCKRLECRLADPRHQFSEDWVLLRGQVLSLQGGPCPEGTYCATRNVLSAEGFCVAPIPVILSPFLMEIYNSVAATALGLRRLAGLQVVLGVHFAMLFGESFFVEDERLEKRMVRRAKVVGFSPKAMEFGVTMPLEYVRRANAFMRGRSQSAEFTSVVVETERNEYVPAVVEDAKVLGLTLSPRSEEGRKAANVLAILTAVFAFISIIVLAISAVNITHTFLMLVTERRLEIAIYRSVGATLWDIRLLVLAEAAFLGFVGGIGGVLTSLVASLFLDTLASSFLYYIPGSPESLFLFRAYVVVASIGCAFLFALVGALPPAQAAAKTDPAKVLAQG